VVALARGVLELRAQELQNPPTPKLWTHERCLAVRCDVRLKPQVETAVKKCIDHFGKLDVVVKYPRPAMIPLIGIVVLDGEY
jgi:NAD(P)-dependent dehydrogenase (short-subunit alcohol dehydrogenase family)